MLNNLLLIAGAAGADETSVTTAMTTAFTSGATEMKNMITTVAPIGIGVVVAGLVVVFGVKFFKRITGKA